MKKLWIIFGSVISIVIVGVGLYFLEESYTEVILHGGDNYSVTVKTEYIDPGFDLVHNTSVISKDKYTYEVNGKVNTDLLGTYKISYDIKYHLRRFHIERTVNVVDDVKPEITANLEKIERDYCTKKDKSKLTYTAIDNYDGDVTSKIEKEEDENNVILKVTDENGNTGELLLPIELSKKPDNYIKLNGSSTIYVTLNGNYSEKGATYYDGCGKKLDDKVSVSGTVNTKKTGTYTLTYSVASGIKKTRKVVVYKQASGSGGNTIISGNGNGKVIYLTFDDGPGAYTQKILNTLAKYNVKATFFVTNQFPGYVKLIKNEYQAGHTVAVHTYSHNYKVYKSVDAYVSDFNKMNNVIEKYTGTKTRLFRFPGGSSNTVSRSYAKGVVKKIANYMTNAGYKYFDWDVDSGDASGASSSKIISNVTSRVKYCSKCIVLMHDIKSTTANALDKLLNTLISKGYRFGTLSLSSPTVHHAIAN